MQHWHKEFRDGGTRPALALLTVLALALTACTGGSSQSRGTSTCGPGDTVVVVGSFPDSGPLAGAGSAGRAVGAYLAKVNADGGINGRRVIWKEYDDAYDPARLDLNARRAVQQDHATAFVSFGAPSVAVRPYLNRSKVFQLVLAGNTVLSDTKSFPFTHAWFPDVGWEAAVDAARLKASVPALRLGILGIANGVPDSAAAGARLVGVSPALVLQVPPSQFDVRAQITQLKAAQVNAVLLVGSPAQVINAVRYIRAIHYTPTIVLNSISAGRKDTIDPLGSDANGIQTSLWLADPADPAWSGQNGLEEFRADMARYGQASDSGRSVALMGYAAAEALVDALRSSAATNADGINRAWNAIRGVSVTGLPPGTTLDVIDGTGRLVHEFQAVRFEAGQWRPLGSPVDAAAQGYVR
jgi:ABC-type branched-subunit amino acid transport system substrate-binding protein